jgi:pyridoxal phosphate enzyme (YggS family)
MHSVDSLRLAELLQSECEKQSRHLDILLEANVSGERSKWGFDPGGLPAVCDALQPFSRLTVRGLMTVAPFHADPEKARPDFERLRLLRDALELHTGWKLPELSMGMSHDFEAAIAEGATLVRIGTLLFGERPKMARLKTTSAEQDFVSE